MCLCGRQCDLIVCVLHVIRATFIRFVHDVTILELVRKPKIQSSEKKRHRPNERKNLKTIDREREKEKKERGEIRTKKTTAIEKESSAEQQKTIEKEEKNKNKVDSSLTAFTLNFIARLVHSI